MDFPSPAIMAYSEAHSKPESDVLHTLNRDTFANVFMPRMLSGHMQGKVLQTISHMVRPEQVLELGTFTGYSAICLAAGLKEGGTVHTVDISPELKDMAARYIREAGLEKSIVQYTGPAAEVIPAIDKMFDIVFIDADKENYSLYYDLVFGRVRNGGFILADNVLWSGKVLEENGGKMDVETKALAEFNRKVTEDERVDNVLIPVRDGLMLIRKL